MLDVSKITCQGIQRICVSLQMKKQHLDFHLQCLLEIISSNPSEINDQFSKFFESVYVTDTCNMSYEPFSNNSANVCQLWLS